MSFVWNSFMKIQAKSPTVKPNADWFESEEKWHRESPSRLFPTLLQQDGVSIFAWMIKQTIC